jgi:hypothetical protein
MNHHEKDQPGISPWRLLALAAIGVCAIVFFQFLASPEFKDYALLFGLVGAVLIVVAVIASFPARSPAQNAGRIQEKTFDPALVTVQTHASRPDAAARAAARIQARAETKIPAESESVNAAKAVIRYFEEKYGEDAKKLITKHAVDIFLATQRRNIPFRESFGSASGEFKSGVIQLRTTLSAHVETECQPGGKLEKYNPEIIKVAKDVFIEKIFATGEDYENEVIEAL